MINDQLDAALEDFNNKPQQQPDMAHQPSAPFIEVMRAAQRSRSACNLQAIHPLLMVAVFTARLRKRSEIVAVFTAKCWELLACGFHRQCTRVGFRRYIMQQHSEDTCRQSE